MNQSNIIAFRGQPAPAQRHRTIQSDWNEAVDRAMRETFPTVAELVSNGPRLHDAIDEKIDTAEFFRWAFYRAVEVPVTAMAYMMAWLSRSPRRVGVVALIMLTCHLTKTLQ